MQNYNLDNNKYYKITEKSGCVSANYNIKGGCKQKLVMIDKGDEISGDSLGMRKYNNYTLQNF